MAKCSSRYAQKRISRKRLQNRKLRTGHKTFYIKSAASPAPDVPKSVTDTARKTGKGKRGAYFIGFAAVIIMALVVAYLANNLTFTLEIPENGISSVAVLSGTHVAASAFLTGIEEMDGVYAEFVEPEAIDFYLDGRQEVALTLLSGRRVGKAVAPLYVLTPLLYLEVEAGTPAYYITPMDFIPSAYIVNSGTVLDVVIHGGLPQGLLEVYEHTVSISVNGVFFYSRVNVVDTTPPTANLMDITIPMGQEVTPDDFTIDYFDFSPVVDIWFIYEPYVFTPGDQTVYIGFEDYFGNTAIYNATLNILPNTVPPQIFGTSDIRIQIGSPIIFRRGVSAEDAFGRPINFYVDSTGVNIHELGTYTATYYAIDPWGLRSEVTIYVYVLEVDPDRVRDMAYAVLENILREGMTQVEQAQAIFDWISNNVAYAANISRRTLYEGAYQAMRNRRGDCFVFYSISEVLLTLAGIPNLHIQRIEGTTTRHSWNLINPDGLGWHHFDTTPLRPIDGQRLNRFMFTSSQARRNTQLIRSYLGTPEYYTYDPDLYPEIVQ